MAFQCHSNQEVIDIVIPVVLNKGNLSKQVMTAILISVKDRLKPSTPASVEVNAATFPFFPEDDKVVDVTGNRRPYILLALELGAPPQKAPKKSNQATNPDDSGEPPNKHQRTEEEEKQHLVIASNPTRTSPCEPPTGKPSTGNPRYSFFMYRCSESAYPAVKGAKQKFAQFLNSVTLFTEHPICTPNSLPNVRQLKPEWYRNSYNYLAGRKRLVERDETNGSSGQ